MNPSAPSGVPISISASYAGNTAYLTTTLKVGASPRECSSGGNTCTAFSVSLAHPYIKVSNDGFTLATAGQSADTSSKYASARASRSRSSGKYYWEITRVGAPSSYWKPFVCSVAPLTLNLAEIAGLGGGYGFAVATARTGDTYGCLLDLAEGSLSWTLNGVPQSSLKLKKD